MLWIHHLRCNCRLKNGAIVDPSIAALDRRMILLRHHLTSRTFVRPILIGVSIALGIRRDGMVSSSQPFRRKCCIDIIVAAWNEAPVIWHSSGKSVRHDGHAGRHGRQAEPEKGSNLGFAQLAQMAEDFIVIVWLCCWRRRWCLV